MSLALLPSHPWPPAPSAEAEPSDRMAWYAAVARWAPSKHNTQPWRFVVRGNALEIWTDPQRVLPNSDPHRRELTLACGAAIHLACVAARAIGFQPHVTVLPDGVGGLLGRLVEVGPWATSAQDRELLALVPRRRTDRGPLNGDALPNSVPFLLQSAAAVEGASLRLVSTVGDRATLIGLVERADRMLVQRADIDRELQRWTREPGDSRRDGVPTDRTRGPAASYRAEFVQRDFSGTHPRPTHAREGVDRPIVGVLCTGTDREVDWISAGRALAAVLLCAAEHGADSSYLNQPVEEPAIRNQLRTMLDLPGTAQVILRIGVGGNVLPTPRRDPDEVTFRVS